MTDERRWLDELPLASAERELLMAGRSARPPGDALEANWRAFSLALNAAPSVATSHAAAHAPSVKATSAIASKAGGGGLLSAGTAKSFALGVALGVGIAGTGAVVEHMSRGRQSPESAGHSPAPAKSPGSAPATPDTWQAQPAAAPPSAREKSIDPSVRPEPLAASGSTPPHAGASSPAAAASASPADTSLSRQARELAVVKRLLDAGSSAEALRRLTTSSSGGGPSALSEERDALYVQALHQAQRRAEARVLARRFVDRYPRSPYLETMRRLAEE